MFYTLAMDLDLSTGTLKAWRNLRRKPLDQAVEAEAGRFKELEQLLAGERMAGLHINGTQLVSEMADLCKASRRYRLDAAVMGRVLGEFAPVAQRFAAHDSMSNVFQPARTLLEKFKT